jgi:hypothetical protein
MKDCEIGVMCVSTTILHVVYILSLLNVLFYFQFESISVKFTEAVTFKMSKTLKL